MKTYEINFKGEEREYTEWIQAENINCACYLAYQMTKAEHLTVREVA